MVRGIGIDLVTVSRFAGIIDRRGDRLLNRVFTEHERIYCARYATPAQHYAVRFAAKEAMLKALGVPRGLSWQELEVRSEEHHPPRCHLSGKAADAAKHLGIDHLWLSLTHERDTAAAVVIAEARDETR